MKELKIFIIILTLLSQTLFAFEDGKKKLTIKDALNWKIPNNIAISPNGDRIAFALTKPDFNNSVYESNIWLINVSSGMVRQFTYGSKNEFSPEFSPDGRYISFIAKRDNENQDEKNGKNQIWLISVAGGEARKLTSVEDGIINYQWSIDGEHIYYTAKEAISKGIKSRKEKNKKIKNDAYLVDEENYKKEIWSINITTKKAEKVFEGDYGLSDIEVSPDGEKILYTTNYTGKPDDSRKFDIWIFLVKDGKSFQLTNREGMEHSPKWSKDGKYVAFLAGEFPEISYSQTDLFVIPSTGGKMENITEEFNRSINSVFWANDNENVFCTVAEGLYMSLYKINIKNKKVEPVIKGDLNIEQFKFSPDGESIVYIIDKHNLLPDIWISNSNGSSQRQLTYLNPEINRFIIAQQEVINYNSKDGLKIEALLVKPIDFQKDKKYPLIVHIHGGPHGRTINTLRRSMEFQVYASNGYVVFSPNFRGSSGYEGSFDIANKGDIGGMDYEDVMGGVDYLINGGIADPEKLGVMGGSYGGYMTNWIISQNNRFKAAISEYGIFNLLTDFSNSYLPSWEKNYLEHYYWENLDVYIKRSPFNYVKNINTPVLIIHGDEDQNTFISNSKEMYAALTHLGKKVEFIRYPREGHGINEPNHRIDLMNRCLEWFEKYIKSEPEAKNIGELVSSDGWDMKVLAVNKIDSHKDEENNTIDVLLNFISEKKQEKKIDINIESEVYIKFDNDKEIMPEGILVKIQNQDVFIDSGKYSLSQIDEKSDKTIIPLTIRFKIPKDLKKAKLKVKDFPFIFINYF